MKNKFIMTNLYWEILVETPNSIRFQCMEKSNHLIVIKSITNEVIGL